MSEAASIFHSGFDGTAAVNVGGTISGGVVTGGAVTEFSLIRWDIEPSAKIVDFMNSRSGLYPVREPTFRDLVGTIDIEYDFANPTYSTLGFNIQPGVILLNVQLFLHQTSRYGGSGVGTGSLDGPYWFIQQAVVDRMPMALGNVDKITNRISWKTASATLTYPS